MSIFPNLVHQLCERNAASTPEIRDVDDPWAVKYRAELINHLQIVFSSSSVPEDEFYMLLKFLSYVATNYSVIFYHGKANAVLPLIGRLLHCFVESAFCSLYGLISDTVASLLYLLRTSDLDAYRQFFVDAMSVVEDLLHFRRACNDEPSFLESKKLPLRPVDGYGILINLTDGQQWQSLSTWIIKILCKCITEGTLYVEGLISMPFVLSVCNLLCYGDADLQMACFDFAHDVGAVTNYGVLPYEKIMYSIIFILSSNEERFPVYSNIVYDSSIGNCLHALHSSCPDDVIRLVASDLVSIFPHALQNTRSLDLKLALCTAYTKIAKMCPSYILGPEVLIDMIYSSDSCFPFRECIDVSFSILGVNLIGGGAITDRGGGFSISYNVEISSPGDGEKRQLQNSNRSKIKRQKINGERIIANEPAQTKPFDVSRDNVDYMRKLLFSFVELLEPINAKNNSFTEVAISSLSMLCIVLCKYPQTYLSVRIFQQMNVWVPWLCEQVRQGSSIKFDLSVYLEAINCMLLWHGPHSNENTSLFQNNESDSEFTNIVLKLPWTHCLVVSEPLWRAKQFVVQVLSKINTSTTTESNFEVLDLALQDEAEEIRIEAVISMPLIVLWSGLDILTHMFNRMMFLESEHNENVKNIIPFSLGYLSCLYGSCIVDDGQVANCKLFLNNTDNKQSQTIDYFLQGFCCAKCDKRMAHHHEFYSLIVQPPALKSIEFLLDCDFIQLQSLFFKCLYNASSEDVQVSCVGVIQRIIAHATKEDLLKTQSQWIECIKFLLLHRVQAVREAFCTQISFFFKEPILTSLFSNQEASGKSNEHSFLEIIRHALAVAEDPQNVLTLLESIAKIMDAVDMYSQTFLFSIILLRDQLDNPRLTVRISVLRLIHQSCFSHCKGGFEVILSKVSPLRDELFDYLLLKLVSQPLIAKEFAEAVIGIQVEELVKKMVPVVLPKIVLTQHNEEAIITLNVLAKHLNVDMVSLIVHWLHKVLAFCLHQVDGHKLVSALHFYHVQTGSDSKELFNAALPNLLAELTCFTDTDNLIEIEKRLERAPQMIREVSRVLTGSEDLPGFLRNQFIGLLNLIDREILHAKDVSLRVQAMKRIEMLIKMMGDQLSTYVPKLTSLIIYAIGKEPLQHAGLSVLHFFLKQLTRVSPSSIKHVISQVFAALIPILEENKETSHSDLSKIVTILELVFKNKIILKDDISKIPPLPSIPALVEVNKAILEARGGSLTLKDELGDVAKGLDHENMNVKYMVACGLYKLLNQRWEDVIAVIIGETCSDKHILNSLITSLLRGCAEESRTSVGQRLKFVCADCLGTLGALDPAKVQGFTSQRFKIECSDDDLIFELIHNHLAQAFTSAPDTCLQDSAALAIQELLQIAGCEASLDENVAALSPQISKSNDILGTSSGSKGIGKPIDCERGRKLWGRFSSYVKGIIAPCLTSRFELLNVSDPTSGGPIYEPSLSFRNWIFRWTKKLIAHATGSRASIFFACRGVVRHDMQFTAYILPYLVLNVVCYGTEEARNGITEEILFVLNEAAENSGAASTGQGEVSIQSLFTLLDNLGQWMDDVNKEIALSLSHLPVVPKQQAYPLKSLNNNALSSTEQLQTQCKHVSRLLDAIPKMTLAQASFRCQAYARSLLYFESYVRGKSGFFNPAAEVNGTFKDEDISYLMEIYSFLDEPDGLSGLAFLRKSVNIQDRILINKKSGNWTEVLASCEQSLEMDPTSVLRHSDVLSCLLNMYHLKAMVERADGLIYRIPQHKKTWSIQGVKAAWRLGRWDLMDEYLDGADQEILDASFDLSISRILQAMMKKDHFIVSDRILRAKQSLIAPLAAAGMDSYTRAYPVVVKLHLLHELEDLYTFLNGESFLEKAFCPDDAEFLKTTKTWENRLGITQPSLSAREPLLAFRRLVLGASGFGAQVGDCWLQYAKLCRSAGHYETANRAILKAQALGAANVHMEKAKLLWTTRQFDTAIAELQQYLRKMPVEIVGSVVVSSIGRVSQVPSNPQFISSDTPAMNDNQDIAKTLLLYARWIHYTGQKQKEDVINLYLRVKDLQPEWEKGYFYMAKYCDELFVDARKRQTDKKEYCPNILSLTSTVHTEKHYWSYLPDVFLFYAKALNRSQKILFQALPRILTLWFDFGSLYEQSGSSSNKDLKEVHSRVMSIMRSSFRDLPTYQWLTVLPQLLSRICHPNKEIVLLVKKIIISVIREYPQQALWIMAAVSKSTLSSRREAAAEIIQAARKGSHSRNNLFAQFPAFIDHLIRLCFHGGLPKEQKINISSEFSALKRMMPLEIIMPTQHSLYVSLQTNDTILTDSQTSNIFHAIDTPTISGICDVAEILTSLQRPKKIFFSGSDGKDYSFLCKPKDDLRKDARMMEFTTMINRLLKKCPESRRRDLYMRTFAVIPLTEDCGMVQWVPHTRGLRQILQDIYIPLGKFHKQKTNPQLKRIYERFQGKIPEDEMLKNMILPLFPPVFHKWYLTTFSEPAAWFRARVAYAHTTAVWSMVGHMVGLGDRHSENILFDSTTGDCVHVDFSCLFDKGLQLEKPELVPFRLTQNIIDGLGITGYEGIFIRICEITLSVLRTHRGALMSILETFIYDPLVEWTKDHKSSGIEVENPHAQRAMNNIEARLDGIVVGVVAAPSLPLSVEGQTRRLIDEAISHKNLGKMYVWWMPWF